MSQLSCRISRTVLLAALVLPGSAWAIPAITCHCFTDRAYDAARPLAADPYFLATTQNSFFAGVFNADRKSIVMQKQQGVSADDLWVAFWAASRSAASPDTLLEARAGGASWQEVLAPLRPTADKLGSRFTGSLAANAPADRLSAAVVDELFVQRRWLDRTELEALRRAGASNQEVIITAVLAARTGQPPVRLYRRARDGERSWGALMTDARIDAKNLQQALSGIFSDFPAVGN